MPVTVNGERIRAMRELKGIRPQEALAKLVGTVQSYVSALEQGKVRNEEVLLKVADVLDCELDFFYARGRFSRNIDIHEGSTELRQAASEMAFVFYAASESRDEWVARCRRVRGHKAAPITAAAWRDLAEQIDLAIGPNGGHLKEVLRPSG